MKNLLLLFVLGFALFWVGCEKENLQQVHLIPSEVETTVAQPPQGVSVMCCMVDPEIQFSAAPTGLWAGVTFMPPFPGNNVIPTKRMVYRVNGSVVHDPDDESLSASCNGANSLQDKFLIPWNLLTECPNLIEISIDLGQTGGLTGFTSCIGDDPVVLAEESYVVGYDYRNPRSAGVHCVGDGDQIIDKGE